MTDHLVALPSIRHHHAEESISLPRLQFHLKPSGIAGFVWLLIQTFQLLGTSIVSPTTSSGSMSAR
jgi:hypothetical protein